MSADPGNAVCQGCGGKADAECQACGVDFCQPCVEAWNEAAPRQPGVKLGEWTRRWAKERREAAGE